MKALYAVGISLMAVAGVFIALRGLKPKPVDLGKEAQEALGCQERNDADCLFNYLTEDEKKATGIDRDGLRKLVREYVAPSFASLSKQGLPIPHPDPVGAEYILSQVYVGEDGRKSSRSVRIAWTPDGPKAIGLASQLVLTSMLARYSTSERASRPRACVIGVDRDRKKLESYGMKGYYRLHPDRHLLTWDEFREWQEGQARQLESAPPTR